jgi:acetyl esterase/lipase
VLPNYRLSPSVRHPVHARDVARAVRWTHDHIAERGGDPARMYLMGHSAGGHLVALLSTDESYLKAEGLAARDIKGVIPVSGVYHIPPGTLEVAIGGTASSCLRPDQLVPLREETIPLVTLPPLDVRIQSDIFGPPFGDDANVRAAASPINHVRRGLPPFLIVCAERDLPTLADMAVEFQKALVRSGCSAELVRLKDRNHNTALFSMIRSDDPAARAVLRFVK